MRQQEDRPLDPNHQNVIDISSDEDYSDDADLDELGNDDLPEMQSAYFQATPDVEAFNAKSITSSFIFKSATRLINLVSFTDSNTSRSVVSTRTCS